MAIFDLDGNELDVAYSLDGVELAEAYDIDGNPLYENDPEVIDDIDLSNVESYFVQPVRDAMAYVKGLGTRGWVHHLITTDNHFPRNYGHSTAIVEAMQSSNYFNKVINLGDIADNGEETSINMAVANYGQFNGDLLYCIGNHDVLFTDWQTYWFTNLLSEDTDIVVDSSSNFNYYWDDSRHRIRYIAYQYNSGTTYAINRIKDAPNGYSVITLCHYPNQIQNSVILPLIGHSVNYIGNIAGHMHVDRYDRAYEGMYNQVMLNNDGRINDNENYPKTDGTANSQAITIMSINTSTKNVKFYRIGISTTLGQNWQYTYVQGGSVEGWLSGYYWGTGGAATSETCALGLKRYPVWDGSGNSINYYCHSNSGTLSNAYTLLLDQNGDSVTRNSVAVSDVFDNWRCLNKGAFYKTPDENAQWYLISFNIPNLLSVDDIVVTTQRPNLGRSYSSSLWVTGIYLRSDGGQSSNETSATTLAFDVLPNTTYRFYVDDAEWEGTSYMGAFTYGATFSIKRRQGKFSGTWKEITFTTNADEYYCRISVQNITTLTDFATKCKLEVVTE